MYLMRKRTLTVIVIGRCLRKGQLYCLILAFSSGIGVDPSLLFNDNF